MYLHFIFNPTDTMEMIAADLSSISGSHPG